MNTLNVKRWKRDSYMESMLRKDNLREWWVQYVHIIMGIGSSYYARTNELFLLPAGFRGTFYNKNRPNYLNFGAIGFLMGKEIVHAMDNVGWEKSTKFSYDQHKKCFEEQYINFSIAEVRQKILIN